LTKTLLTKKSKSIVRGEWVPSKKLFLSSAILFVLVSFLFVDSVGASSEMWSRTYGGEDGELAYSLVVTSDGGYALAGYTYSFGAEGANFWLVKTDSYGNMQWNKTYGGLTAHSLIQTSDGGFALAGETIFFSTSAQDFYVVKTDSDGNMQWNRTYGGEHNDIAHSLVETSDGGFAIAGHTGWLVQDFLLIKTDADGNMLWNRTYGGYASDFAYSLVETSDGGYAIAGETNSFDGLWLVKTDVNGNMMWNRTYSEGSVWDTCSLVVTSDGGFAIAGDSGGAGFADFLLVKTDNQGNMEWSRTYGGTEGDYAYSLVETSDGGYAIAGVTHSFDAGQGDFWLVKIDVDGNMMWSRTYGGMGADYGYSLVQTYDGGYAIAGVTGSFGAEGSNFWLVKTDEYGVVPEYSSWLLTSLLLTATLVIVVYKKRLFYQSS
jgi:hypothetical protein